MTNTGEVGILFIGAIWEGILTLTTPCFSASVAEIRIETSNVMNGNLKLLFGLSGEVNFKSVVFCIFDLMLV